MSNNSTHISVPIKGMNTDVHPANLSEQGYDFAQNAVVEETTGNGFPMLQNESSTIKGTGFPAGYKVIGVVNVTEQDRKIFFLHNPSTGFGQIGEVLGKGDCDGQLSDNDDELAYCADCEGGYVPTVSGLEIQNLPDCVIYKSIATQSCFNFNVNNPVKAVYRIEECGLSVYFTDNRNPYRYIQFEYVDDDPSKDLLVKKEFKTVVGYSSDCNEPIYGTQVDCNKLLIDPIVEIPTLEFIDVVSGGSLQAGVYQFLIAYAEENGDKRTPYFHATNPIPIKTREVTFETDYVTDRAIHLKVESITKDSPYQFYNIAVAKTVNGVTSFEFVGTYPVTNTTITYTGNEKSQKDLTHNEIFEPKVYYAKAKTVASSNDYLFWASLEETKKLNLQPVANKVKLYWQTIAVPENVYRDPRHAAKFRGYMRDEVYAFGIVFIYDNGEESPVFHIPGRQSLPSDLEIVTNDDAIKESNCVDCEPTGTTTAQILPTTLNNLEYTDTPSGVTLNENNAVQAASCPIVAHSEAATANNNTGLGAMPSVNAGVDRTITSIGGVGLEGTVVANGGSSIVSTLWKQLSGPNKVNISNAGSVNTFFENYNAGTYEFQLVATDTFGNVQTDNVVFTIDIPVNKAPIADPGEDKAIALPTDNSFLNGANSSDDDGIKSYEWSQVSGPNTANIVNPNAPYTGIENLVEGVYVFKLKVTDMRGCFSEATTKVHVLPDPADGIPTPAKLLYPLNGDVTDSALVVTLDWEDVSNATSYDVYVKQEGGAYELKGNTTESTFTLLALTKNTVYHWYVVPKNDTGSAVNPELYYRSFATPVENTKGNCDKPKWRVYNTATVIGGPKEPYQECEETCWEYGEFAYWESIERYPNNPEIWGELCNKPIRHHKFPDSIITHIHDGKEAPVDFGKSNYIYPIGVKVDHNSIVSAINNAKSKGIITEKDALRIKGYKIVRGNRFQNKSVVAKGLLYDVNQYKRKFKGQYFDNQPIFFPNYPYNDLRANPFLTDDFRNYDIHNRPSGSDLPFLYSKRYTFHSPDTHFTEPSIGTMLKLETVEYGASEGYFTKSKKQAKQKFLSNMAYNIAFSAGIIAALTKTTEKEYKEYTAKGQIISAMGVASGTLGPFLPFAGGPGAGFLGNTIPDSLINPKYSGAINTAHEAKVITVQGKQSDFLNPIYLALKKPYLLPLWLIMSANAIANFLTTVLTEADIVINMIKSLTPYRDWTIQYNSVGRYNAYKPVPNTGNKIRNIVSHSYLKSEVGLISEPSTDGQTQTTIKFNNWHRETGLYLRYGGHLFPNASVFSGVEDKSRYTFEDSEVGEKLDKRVQRPISSYYASIKNYVPDQYGDVFNIEYIPTGSDTFKVGTSNSTCKTVYGGDTFINRFAIKRKVPYFLADTFEMMNGIDFNYADYPNLAVPRHYYDSTTGVATEFDEIKDALRLFTPEGIATFLGRPKSIRDGSTNKFFYQNGYIYLYHYGIPYFLVESDINLDMRHAENMTDKAFYPLQSDLDFWLQEENVRIREDNWFVYNNTYSKQNKEHIHYVYPRTYEPGRDCRVSHPNRIIYSNGKNWLAYKANDLYDFPLSKGKLIGVDGMENDKVLVRSENTTQVFNAYVTMQASQFNIQVGTGGMFATKPQEYASTTLGYAGTQHNAILHTEFGHIWVDAKRGQVFNLTGGQLNEISKDGMRNWFKENLPFQLLKDFPNMSIEDLDNNFKGVGITLAFDKRFARFLLTKLDYKVLDKSIIYDSNQKQFKKGTEVVNLDDSRYFCNRSWTISYSFYLGAWVSFHSYKPNFYVDGLDYFASGLNTNGTLWLHGVTNKSYQVVYDKVEPFTIQSITKGDVVKNGLMSVEFGLDAIRYHNDYDPFFTNDVTFNKAIVFNQNQNSGLLKLDYKTKKDLSELAIYPITNVDSTSIRVTNADGIWRFNQFYDISLSRGNNIPLWINNCANTEKVLNNKALDYQMADLNKRRLRGEYCRVRLTNDVHTKHKLIFKWLVNKSVKSYR